MAPRLNCKPYALLLLTALGFPAGNLFAAGEPSSDQPQSYSPQQHDAISQAAALREQGRLDAAREALERALEEAGSDDIALREAYADVLLEQEAWPEAEAQYAEVTRRRGDKPGLWSAYADTLRQQGKFDEALTAYDTAIRLDPYLFEAVFGRARSLEQMGRVEEANRWYERLLQIPGSQPRAHRELAAYGLRTGNYRAALTHAQAGLELADQEPDPELLVIAAEGAHHTQQHRLKVQYAIALMGSGYESTQHIDWAAVYYASVGELDEAIKLFHRAVELKPDSQYHINNLGYTYFLRGDYEEAIAVFDRGLALTGSEGTGDNVGLMHYNKGQAYRKLGQSEQAEAALQMARDNGYPP